MTKRWMWVLGLIAVCSNGAGGLKAQQDVGRISVNVVLVQLDVAVTDRRGNYVTGLKPEDFIVTEDKITEKIANFEEGAAVAQPVAVEERIDTKIEAPVAVKKPEVQPATPGSRYSGASVFILFDTSNYMYKNFVYAQDAIADFVRSLEGVNRVALYSYSRNLSRVAPLTSERAQILRGVHKTVAGDDEALYNSLLLTVKDAAPITGRKAIVVFSNGPDNASLVPPEDVAELAQSTGTIIYMMSTRAAQQDPLSTAVFERVSKATGGKAYFSKDWKDQKQAFDSIRDDLAHLYSISYYPQSNPNKGWRNIGVKLVGKNLQKYNIRTRVGYRLLNQPVASLGGGENGVTAAK